MPDNLPAHLISLLALLSGEEGGVAEVALSTLSAQDLVILIQHEIIAPIDPLSDEVEEIILSAHGRSIIVSCGLDEEHL